MATARTEATRYLFSTALPPLIHSLKNETEEPRAIGGWIMEHVKAGVLPHDSAFSSGLKSNWQGPSSSQRNGHSVKILDEQVETTTGYVSISTMHLAKGLGVPRCGRYGL